MEKLKVLNLYAGIGGNRKLWEDVDVTAVEYNSDIAAMYKRHFPDDKLIIGDAKEYLLNHYKDFNFIWASPPCQSHTAIRLNFADAIGDKRRPPKMPDMSLYQIILFVDNYFKGKYCIENVIPFYEPLIKGKKIGRHLFWANFNIGAPKTEASNILRGNPLQKAKDLGYDLSGAKFRKDTMINNMVHPETGLYILNCARNIITKSNVNQIDLFK